MPPDNTPQGKAILGTGPKQAPGSIAARLIRLLACPTRTMATKRIGLAYNPPVSLILLCFAIAALTITMAGCAGFSSNAGSPSPALAITTSVLPSGTAQSAYNATLAAAGGTTPYTWSITSGSLPTGVTLTASSGLISGTPTQSGTFPITVQVKDSSSPAQTASQGFSIVIAAAGAPVSITTSSVPSGTQNVGYSTTLAATGGKTPYTWSITSGSLPTGVTLTASSGLISGTPTQSGTFPITVQVKDSSSPAQTASQGFSIVIAAAGAPVSITTSSVPSGTQNVGYSTTLAATGGKTPYTWSITSGSLPTGVTLTASSGLIAGTPTQSGTFPITVQVKDSSSPAQTASQGFSIVIAAAGAPVSITTSSVPSGTQNVGYSTTLAATGGKTPYTWSITSGSLPTGVTLTASSGLISGTPTQSGTFPITVQVKDSSSPAQTASQGFSIVIAAAGAPVSITTSSVPSGTQNVGYSTTLAATGGKTPYTWSITSGSLPTGVTLTASSGLIAGTPTQSGTFPVTVQVRDSSSPAQTASQSFSIVIAPDATIPSTFFGMHLAYGETGYSTPILPPIQVGAMGKPPGTNWEFVETARGSYNWNNLDDAVSYASAHNVPIFVSHENVPIWVTSDTSTCFLQTGVYHCPAPPSDENIVTTCQGPLEGVNTTDCMWKEFLTSIVNRYKSTGIQTGCSSSNPQCHGVIQMYEGWNEPGGLVMTIGEFVTFETDFLNTVRANDPSAQSCSPAFLVGPGINLQDNFFANGAPKTWDCYDFHINEPTPEGQIADINQFKSILSSNGIDPSTATIYATEAGRWGTCSATLSPPLTQQAYIARIELLYWSNNVKRHYWFAYDICVPLTNQPASSTLTPAGIAYGNVESWMVGATMSTPCTANGTVWTCGLSRPDGYQALAVWDTTGNSTFGAPSQYTQYQDLEGNTYAFSGSVTIGPEPILLTNGVAP